MVSVASYATRAATTRHKVARLGTITRMDLLEVDEPRTLLSIPQVQHVLGGVSRKTIYRLIDRGDLVRVKIRGRAMVTAESMTGLVRRAVGS